MFHLLLLFQYKSVNFLSEARQKALLDLSGYQQWILIAIIDKNIALTNKFTSLFTFYKINKFNSIITKWWTSSSLFYFIFFKYSKIHYELIFLDDLITLVRLGCVCCIFLYKKNKKIFKNISFLKNLNRNLLIIYSAPQSYSNIKMYHKIFYL